MEQVKAWVFQLVVIGLGGVIAGSLIHRESFQRYVKLVVGFLMIMVLIQPVMALRDSAFDPSSLLGEDMGDFKSESNAIAGNIQRVNEDWLDAYAVEDIQNQIRAEIRTGIGCDCRVDVTLEAGGTDMEEVRISVYRPLTEDERQWILTRLEANYALTGNRVRISGG
jgi:stage III sporulation protein AF